MTTITAQWRKWKGKRIAVGRDASASGGAKPAAWAAAARFSGLHARRLCLDYSMSMIVQSLPNIFCL